MLNSARLLVEKYDSSAYKINEVHDGDIVEIVKALTVEERYGFSTKKAHMFLRGCLKTPISKTHLPLRPQKGANFA
ncbi:hypothetical protein HKBW3S09_00667 [Candidatus Hakubella thermalkaliphila]|uniref:Uncharacterized protein n=3 Tax=Candidatus Hakubella thermalkaliphila TaxID=2754717 RepID=A0A6V8NUT1_9ACTN|nr:hypothetical protein HKBW3S09_00667 [Candidatus Hakubella thermalkaliphila]